MVRHQTISDDDLYFDPDETATLKSAYDDALAKLVASRAALGSSEALASNIVRLGKLRTCLGMTLTGQSDAQLLSFLALQALK